MPKDAKGHGSNKREYALGNTTISPKLAKTVAGMLAAGHSPSDIGAAVKKLAKNPANAAKMFPKGRNDMKGKK